MVFLGVLLVIVGIGLLCTGAIVIGLIPIALGILCFTTNTNNKTEKEEKKQAVSKEDWILKQTKTYMDSGMNPSDAKVKAEVDYQTKCESEKVQIVDGMWVCPKCGKENYETAIICVGCCERRNS